MITCPNRASLVTFQAKGSQLIVLKKEKVRIIEILDECVSFPLNGQEGVNKEEILMQTVMTLKGMSRLQHSAHAVRCVFVQAVKQLIAQFTPTRRCVTILSCCL